MSIEKPAVAHRLRRIALALAVATAPVTAPVTAAAETLTDALISAYQNSNLLEQNRAVLRAADEDVARAIAALRPTLDFVATYGWSNVDQFGNSPDGQNPLTSTYAIVLQLVILDGGQRGLQTELAKETVLATRESLLGVEQNVLLSAVSAYAGVLSALAFVDLGENNLRLIQEELEAAQDRFEVGEVTRTDVALAESRLAQSRSQLAAARGQLETAREAYRVAVGRYPGTLIPPSSVPETASTVEEALSIAVRRHPAIRQAQREVTASDISVEIASRAYGPTVSATGRWQVDDDRDDESRLGLEFRQPIYTGGRLPSLERRAIAVRDETRARLHETTLNVREAVANAFSQIRVFEAQIAATQEQVRAAEIAFEGTREEARLGARTTLDVLDSEQDLLDARAAEIDARAQRFVAIYSLLSAMGLLNVQHLQLGIPTYDPSAYYNAVKTAPARLSEQGEALDRVLKRIGRQ
ncbi:MAG: TolC family outer membrane protein [Pseudomonadota bacterium]